MRAATLFRKESDLLFLILLGEYFGGLLNRKPLPIKNLFSPLLPFNDGSTVITD